MKIEIITRAENDPVAEFFSSSNTPETDVFFDHAISTKNKYPGYAAPFEGFCQKLERERDEWAKLCGLYKQERDDAIKNADYYRERYEQLKDAREAAQ